MSPSSSNVPPEGAIRRVVLSLGSNLGRRELNVLRAAGAVAVLPGVSRARLSSLYESEPVGAGFGRPFVNAVMMLETRLEPRALQAACRRLEDACGPRGDAVRMDRRLDIDIVIFGDLRCRLPGLILPHPRFRQRLFVLEPLAELAPDLALPPDGEAAAEAARRLVGGCWVRRISSRRLGGVNLL